MGLQCGRWVVGSGVWAELVGWACKWRPRTKVGKHKHNLHQVTAIKARTSQKSLVQITTEFVKIIIRRSRAATHASPRLAQAFPRSLQQKKPHSELQMKCEQESLLSLSLPILLSLVHSPAPFWSECVQQDKDPQKYVFGDVIKSFLFFVGYFCGRHLH